jgi:hypothetical protein
VPPLSYPTIMNLLTLWAAKSMGAEPLDRERIRRVVLAMPALVGAVEKSTTDSAAEKSDEISWQDLLEDYYRVMEIAHYVRRGGVKAMMYRVETGRAQFSPNDYFDEAHQELCEAFRGSYSPPSSDREQPVLERLAAVSREEEDVVREYLPDIDHILLSGKRKEAALSEE